MQPTSSELLKTWMTGLGNAGLNACAKVDDATIAVSGEGGDKQSVVAYKTLNGDTVRTIKMGVEQIRAICFVEVDKTKYLVVTKQEKIELWDHSTGKILDKLKIEGFDPCAVCVASWNTVLVASWSQETPNLDESRESTTIVELQIIGSKFRQLDRNLEIKITCVIGMVRVFYRMHRIIVLTSFNNDLILAVNYTTGERVWRICELEYEGEVIRPNGICSDGSGHVYIADTGLSHCRVFVLTSGGMIVKKLLDTAGWCDDVTWIAEDKRLVVLHDKTGLKKQDVSVYNIKYIIVNRAPQSPEI